VRTGMAASRTIWHPPGASLLPGQNGRMNVVARETAVGEMDAASRESRRDSPGLARLRFCRRRICRLRAPGWGLRDGAPPQLQPEEAGLRPGTPRPGCRAEESADC
jgi:hypothetical protein